MMASSFSSSAALSLAAPSTAGVVPSVENNYEPVDGSWVAEYEEAKEDLLKALRSQHGDDTYIENDSDDDDSEDSKDDGNDSSDFDDSEDDDDDDSDDDSDGAGGLTLAVLHSYLRLCRACSMLRRWNRLLIVSKKALKACGTYDSVGTRSSLSSPPAMVMSEASTTFQNCHDRAKAELTITTQFEKNGELVPLHANIRHDVLKEGSQPRLMTFDDDMSYANASMLQEAILMGDMLLMEKLVALGAPIDSPIKEHDSWTGTARLLPPGATALVVACAMLAMPESARREWSIETSSEDVGGEWTLAPSSDVVDRIAQCATQLIHLGADPKQTMPRGLGAAFPAWEPFEGKSAFLIASMSNYRPLAALMSEHMQLSLEERAEVVHCRCGSRLPWKKCHLTGVGQPSHYAINTDTQTICYRVSPMALCPCKDTKKTYYKCCWKDNRVPVYLHDKLEASLSQEVDPSLPTLSRCLREEHGPSVAVPTPHAFIQLGNGGLSSFPLLRAFAALREDLRPKSRMAEWDPQVYAGCVERLEEPFLWRDVHWDLDRSILLRRSEAWNQALEQYCDDKGLPEGADRERVVRTHSANPCGPCGYAGCSAVESQVREFRRCSVCKSIAYCSRTCQAKDWAEHKKVCQGCPTSLVDMSAFDGDEPVDTAWRCEVPRGG